MPNKMITSQELRKKLQKLSKKEGLVRIARSSFMNDTFKGDFNYSMGEEPIMRKFGKYLPIEKNWSFSVFQPCIRIPDFHKGVKKNSARHLMVFEMSDVGGVHVSKDCDGRQIRKKIITSVFNFLTKELKIDAKYIYVSYFSGNDLNTLSQKKLQSKKKFSADRETIAVLEQLGISKKQLIADPNAFVLTFFPFEFYAGYRSEIFVKTKKGLLEVGTMEFMNYKTKLGKDGLLKDIENADGFFGACGVGMERLLMAANNYTDIFHGDHIFPLFSRIMKLSKKKNILEAHIVCEVIRLLQVIVSDGYDFENDTYPKRKIKIKKLIRQFLRAAGAMELDIEKNIDSLLDMNAQLIPFKPKKSIRLSNKKIRELICQFE